MMKLAGNLIKLCQWNNLNINGKVVIGEGELDEAPMLFIGEKVGLGTGISVDIAVDPLEGTNFVANNKYYKIHT